MAQPNIRTSTPSPVPVLTVTVKTAAEITGLSRSTLLRRADEGELRTVLCHGRRLVVLASLKRMLGLHHDEEVGHLRLGHHGEDAGPARRAVGVGHHRHRGGGDG